MNLILYGPPGTGKTYALLKLASEHFSESEEATAAAESLGEYPLWQVVAAALFFSF